MAFNDPETLERMLSTGIMAGWTRASTGVPPELADGQQLDAIAEFFGILDIHRRDIAEIPFNIDIIVIDVHAVGQCR